MAYHEEQISRRPGGIVICDVAIQRQGIGSQSQNDGGEQDDGPLDEDEPLWLRGHARCGQS